MRAMMMLVLMLGAAEAAPLCETVVTKVGVAAGAVGDNEAAVELGHVDERPLAVTVAIARAERGRLDPRSHFAISGIMTTRPWAALDDVVVLVVPDREGDGWIISAQWVGREDEGAEIWVEVVLLGTKRSCTTPKPVLLRWPW